MNRHRHKSDKSEQERDRAHERGLREEISSREERKRRARERKKHESVWFGLGMFGLVGWSVAIPTLIFLAIGVWMDSAVDDRISWTLTGLVVGVALGCLNAWYWVKRESSRRD